MDVSYGSPVQPQKEASTSIFDCDVSLFGSCNPLVFDPSFDSGYFSACSSLSPTSSVDSFSLSPNSLQVKKEQDPQDCLIFSRAPHQAASTIKILPQPACTASATKKSRSRYPGKKRQTASEREKLRMRDLTKALHHLRSFLPASVAPERQALTKIETLRLTIRYITHLSTQLGLTEENLELRRASGHEEQTAAIVPLQETLCSPQSGPCPDAYASPMVSAKLCYSTQGWVPQQQLNYIGFNGQY